MLLVQALVFYGFFSFQPQVPSSSIDTEKEIKVEPGKGPKPNPHIAFGTIANKSSLYSSLKNAGVPLGLVIRIVQSLQKVFDLRCSSPGDIYALEYCPPDELLNFEYRSSGHFKYLVLPENDSLVAYKRQKDLERSLRYVGGKLHGSLCKTMAGMGEAQTLIFKLTGVFEWEIDFLTDVRDGDEFELIVERFKEEGKPAFDGEIVVAKYSLQGSDHFGILYPDSDSDGSNEYYDLDGKSLRKTLLKSPLNYRRISSKYSLSRLHPILKIRRPHYGVDYAAKKGTPVVAAGDGKVIYKGWKGDYGNTIVIRHSHGLQTCYGHLSAFSKKLKKGQRVKQGQLIGYVGSTGLSTGPHLDYRVKKDGRYFDPLKLVSPSVKPVRPKYLESFCKVRDEMLSTMQSMSENTKVIITKSQEEHR